MAWDRRALIGTLLWCAGAACGGNPFRSEPGSAGGNGGAGAGQAGSNAPGGALAMGGMPAMAGSAGLSTSGDAAVPGGAAGEGQGEEGGAGGAAAEVPSIPRAGLVYWFKADKGVVEMDGGVRRWSDQSGNNHHATQLLAELRPKVTRSELLPLAVLELDGVDDRLELPPVDLDVSAGLSFFAVAGRREQSTCSAILELSNKPEEEDISFDSTRDSYQFEIFGDTVVATEGVFPLGTLRLLESVYTVDGEDTGTVDLRVNGASVASAPMHPPVELTREKNYIGHSQYAECTPFPGVLAEIILYERPVSRVERLAVEAYLKAKWQCCG